MARSEALGAFDACGGYSGDGGYPTAQAWLRNQGGITGKAARDLVAWERMLKAHPVLRGALAAEQLSESWAGQFARWNDRLPDTERDKADQILLNAALDGPRWSRTSRAWPRPSTRPSGASSPTPTPTMTASPIAGCGWAPPSAAWAGSTVT